MRDDLFGLFWHDVPTSRKRGERVLGPMPPIPDTGWVTPNPSDLPDLRDARVMAFDVETWDPELNTNGPGWARGKGHIVGFSMAVEGRKIYIPIRHEVHPEQNLDPAKMLDYFKHCMSGPGDKVGANLLYDVGWCRQEGIEVCGDLHDVQFAEAILHSQSKLNLDELAYKYTGAGKDADLLKQWVLDYYGGPPTKWRANIYRCPPSLVGAYGERDADAPLQVIKHQIPRLIADGLYDLYRMECDLIPLLCDMRFQGVSVDIPYVEQLRDDFVAQEKELQAQIDRMAGFSVNTNAGDSLARAFDNLGIDYPRTKPTETNPTGKPSFVKEFLEQHSHPFPKLITETRGLSKLRGTFLESYLLEGHVDGKVYGSFHPLSGTEGGARTGRFASSMPNLQNIPTRTANGKKIRNAFTCDPGHDRWEKWDYSQIEYRFLAHFATGEGSDDIRAAYLRDPKTDYHNSTAALIEGVTGVKLQRSYVKNINFGLAYGMGLDKLAKDLGVSRKEAEELSKAYHKGVPFARKTMEMLSDFAARMGYIETILGRRNHFDLWEPDYRNHHKPALPYEQALYEYGSGITRAYLYRTLNYVLQGSSADQMKSAMLKAYKTGVFRYTGVPRLTVHDELDFSVSGHCEEAFAELQRIMQTIIPLRVPVVAEREVGTRWGNVQKISDYTEANDNRMLAQMRIAC